MCVKANHEEEREMMCVPECLKALIANLVMGGGIHDKHDKKHEVTSNAARLCIVDLLSGKFPKFWIIAHQQVTSLSQESRAIRLRSTLIKLT